MKRTRLPGRRPSPGASWCSRVGLLVALALPAGAPAAEEAVAAPAEKAEAAPATAPPEEAPATAPGEKSPVVDCQDVPSFGPDSVGAQLRTDSAALGRKKGVLLRPYYAFKNWLEGQAGLAFGADYAFMGQYAAPSLDERTAAVGV